MDHLVDIKFLGMGKFSEVRLIKNSTTNELLVVKKIFLANITNLKEKGYIQNEIRILKKIKNNNIINLYNTFQNKDCIYLFLEYCNGGTIKENLDKYLNKTGKPFPEKYIQHLMKQILLGVKYLHDNGIIHRDLKLNNILLKYKNNYDLNNINILSAQAKIIDFNLSYIKNNYYEPYSVVGTLPNMAPNIIYNINNNQKKSYDEKVDIWSVGTLCYEMLFGKPLFQNMTQEDICKNIINANFVIPNNISIQARDFLDCMLQKDKNYIYSASQLLNHQFIIGDYHSFIMRGGTTINNNDSIKLKKINIPKVLVPHRSKENIIKKKISSITSLSPQKNKMNLTNYGIICKGKGCHKIIHGIYYKCLKCNEFNYCKKCYYINMAYHPHSFEIIGGDINSNSKIKLFEQKINYQKIPNSHQIPNKTIKKVKMNVIFDYNGKLTVMTLDEDMTIKKLLEYYFIRINRIDLINNYQNEYKFYYDGKNLIKLLDRHIMSVIRCDHSKITVAKIDKF